MGDASPSSLDALYAERLDRLPAGPRGAPELAAVIGARFWSRAVVELGHASFAAAVLPDLRRRGLVRSSEQSAMAGEPDLVFSHPGLRQAILARLPRTTRRGLHQRVATWLEARSGGRLGRHAAILGRHWASAGRSDKALEFELRAATAARRACALDAAIEHLERALDLCGQLEEPAPARQDRETRIRAELADALRVQGDMQGAVAAAWPALQVEAGGDELLARLGLAAGWATVLLGRYDEGRALLEAALERARRVPGATLLCTSVTTGVAFALDKAGDHTGCRALLAPVLAGPLPAWDESEESLARGEAARIAGNAALRAGALADADACYEQALELVMAAHAPEAEVEVLNGKAALAYARGELDVAEGTWRDALGLATRWELLQRQAILGNNLGELLSSVGRYAEAVALLAQAVAVQRYLQLDEVAETARLLGECQAALGDRWEAERSLLASLVASERTGHAPFEAAAHLALARLRLEADGPEEVSAVAEHLDAAERAYRRCGDEAGLGEVARLRGGHEVGP